MKFNFDFAFPYKNFIFPGKHTEEKVLYVTRQHPIIFKWHLAMAFGSLVFVNVILFLLFNKTVFFQAVWSLCLLLSFVIGVGLFWWIRNVYKQSLFIVTNRRLTQFVQTSPFTNYQLSLSLDQVVDTAASTHTLLQRLFGLGSLFARSSAGAQGDFLVENLQFHHDLHNWLTKLLAVYMQKSDKEHALDNFRPFIPSLKGEARKVFLQGKTW